MIAKIEESPWTLVTNPEEWGIYLVAIHAPNDESHPRFPFLVMEEHVCDNEEHHLFVTMDDAMTLMVASLGFMRAAPNAGSDDATRREDLSGPGPRQAQQAGG
jgi:hypothetical protein